MQNQARAVYIGRGVVRASIVYHLSKLGCGDTIMLEQTELPSSSTWCAAGGYAHGAYKSMAQGYMPKDIANHDSGWSVEMLRKSFR